MIESARTFAERETRIAPPRPPDKFQPVQATMPEPEIVTRQGKPASVIIALVEETVLKKGMEEKSREFVEKGCDLYAKAQVVRRKIN